MVWNFTLVVQKISVIHLYPTSLWIYLHIYGVICVTTLLFVIYLLYFWDGCIFFCLEEWSLPNLLMEKRFLGAFFNIQYFWLHTSTVIQLCPGEMLYDWILCDQEPCQPQRAITMMTFLLTLYKARSASYVHGICRWVGIHPAANLGI